MSRPSVGEWVEIVLVDGRQWIGVIEEWDEDAIYITNGIPDGEFGHKGAECTNDEAEKVIPTQVREFKVC